MVVVDAGVDDPHDGAGASLRHVPGSGASMSAPAAGQSIHGLAWFFVVAPELAERGVVLRQGAVVGPDEVRLGVLYGRGVALVGLGDLARIACWLNLTRYVFGSRRLFFTVRPARGERFSAWTAMRRA